MEEEQTTGTETTEEGLTEDQQQDPSVNDQEVVQETQSPVDYQQLYSEQLELTNHILTGQVFFMGLIFGVLLFKIFWDRWKV